jgi:D-beta-D-heptose 7-phosphate kinase/D-beta-D-heptose 1-phosphate adenosyltransferase
MFGNNKKDICIISGYFDPIHIGHLEYIEKSKKLAKTLIVIINNNKQAQLKKGNFFMDENERKQILDSIIYTDETIMSIDTDKTVCKTIEKIAKQNSNKTIIFANGGDRNNKEIPESGICKNYRIEIKDSLGLKIQSSSTLIKNSKPIEIGNRPWGTYFTLEEEKKYKIKRIEVEVNGVLSLQSHTKRKEFWVIVQGTSKIVKGAETITLKEGNSIIIEQGEQHRISNIGVEKLIFIEVQYGSYLGEDDIKRFDDIYNRK